jgi:small conductance mechanosensitive channel
MQLVFFENLKTNILDFYNSTFLKFIPLPVARIFWILVVSFVFYFFFKKFGEDWLNNFAIKKYKTENPEVIKKRTNTIHHFLLNALKTIMIFIVFFLVLDELGVNIAPFLTGAGILGVAIGFGSQTLVKDYISGILILVEDQFRKGDEVEIAKLKGKIKNFSLRKTVLIDKEGVFHYVPNSQITTVSNFTRSKKTITKK